MPGPPTPQPVVVYGFHREERLGNLWFRKTSVEGFLNDLASCRAVICAGSHTLTSEALYYGKPVLAHPFAGAFEQVLNAFYLEKLGYGKMVLSPGLEPRHWQEFQEEWGRYRHNLGKGHFLGNEEVFSRVGEFIRRQGQVPW